MNIGANSHSDNGRTAYYRDTLHLNHDPFSQPIAELEIQTNPDDPPFLTYFVDPFYETPNGPLLDKLQQPGIALVYGARGSGKTMLSYRLDAACRETAENCFVIRYELGKDDNSVNPEKFWPILVETLATDLFVQVLENFDTYSAQQLKEITPALTQYWIQTIPQFQHKIQRLLSHKQSSTISGLSAQWWSVWQRPAVRYTPYSAARERFLTDIATWNGEFSDLLLDESAFQYGISLVSRIGFLQIFFLVDITDSYPHDRLTAQLTQLWVDIFALHYPISLFPKLFLPEALRTFMEDLVERSSLISPPFSAIMLWNNSQAFSKIIKHRFQSAGSWIKGFDVLASQEVVEGLTEAIFHAADQSPRRLLQIHSLLIDAHISRDPKDPQFTIADWQRMCNLWPYGDPRPTPLLSSFNKGDLI